MKAVKRITRIIPEGTELPIGDQDGNLIISQSKTIFRSWIDPDFKKFGLDKPNRPTGKINTVVHEMIGRGNFLQIFKDIDSDLDKSILTMSQIIEFCRQHPDWLRQESSSTFFLTRKRNNFFQRAWCRVMEFIFNKEVIKSYFVVCVRVVSGGLFVSVRRLELDCVWSGKDRHRVVFPQLIS